MGGAEIYHQVLALSSPASHTPTTPTGPGSATGTDTEGEATDPFKEREQYDVRILQTQIRKLPNRNLPSPIQDPNLRRKSRVEEPDFECDTFFPDLLPYSGAGVKSGKWKAVSQEKMQDWIDDEVELPQHLGRRKESIQHEVVAGLEEESDEDEEYDGGQGEPVGTELWARDEKADVEIRVVGWQRR